MWQISVVKAPFDKKYVNCTVWAKWVIIFDYLEILYFLFEKKKSVLQQSAAIFPSHNLIFFDCYIRGENYTWQEITEGEISVTSMATRPVIPGKTCGWGSTFGDRECYRDEEQVEEGLRWAFYCGKLLSLHFELLTADYIFVTIAAQSDLYGMLNLSHLTKCTIPFLSVSMSLTN